MFTVIANYPPGKPGSTAPGIYAYVRSKCRALAAAVPPAGGNGGGTLQVFAEIVPGEPKSSRDGSVLVRRLWRPGSPWAWASLVAAVLKLPRGSTLLVELEFNMFRSWASQIGLLAALAAARIRGLRSIVEFHQVVRDPEIVASHFNLRRGGIAASLMWRALNLYSVLAIRLASRYAAHESRYTEHLERLSGVRGAFVPHGVWPPDAPPATREAARAALGLPADRPLLLVFGFLNWYKGVDRLLEAYRGMSAEWRGGGAPLLVLAGGPSPNRVHSAGFRAWSEAELGAARSAGAITPGFIPGDQVSAYFLASDIALLPYVAAVSSSGPFAHALGHRTPFLLSRELSLFLESEDLRAALEANGIDAQRLLFGDAAEFEARVRGLLEDRDFQDRVRRMLERISADRDWRSVAEKILALTPEPKAG